MIVILSITSPDIGRKLLRNKRKRNPRHYTSVMECIHYLKGRKKKKTSSECFILVALKINKYKYKKIGKKCFFFFFFFQIADPILSRLSDFLRSILGRGDILCICEFLQHSCCIIRNFSFLAGITGEILLNNNLLSGEGRDNLVRHAGLII